MMIRMRLARPTALRRGLPAALWLLATPGQGVAPAAPPAPDPAMQRAEALRAAMTLDEKVTQMGNSAPAIPRLQLPAYQWENECTHGVVAEGATVFPQAVALAACWDPGLAGRVARAIGEEAVALHARGRGGLTFWAPVLNLARDPRWGRTQETFGEDPLLAALLGVEFVRGLQRDPAGRLRAIATLKHFAANNDEAHRHTGSSDMPPWQLRAFYLPHFAAAIRDGGARSVMCAYNALNGTPCCANRWLLDETLRSAWGFDGYVVGDCGAVGQIETTHRFAASPRAAAAAALNAGVDLDCGDTYQRHLAAAVREGLIAESAVDRAVSRLLAARAGVGLLDPPAPEAAGAPDPVDCPAHRALAREVAEQSIVLLRNPGGLLPFRKQLRSVAVIGPSAAVKRLGTYSAWRTRVVTPLEGIEVALGPKVPVRFAPGCEVSRRTPMALPGLRAEYFANSAWSGEPALRRTDSAVRFHWEAGPPAPGLPAEGYSVRWTGTLTAPVTRRTRLAITAADSYRLVVDGRVLAAHAGARPRTTETSELELRAGEPHALVVEYANHGGESGVELGWDLEPDRAMLAEAVAAARGAAACVVVVGTDRYTDNEGMNRPDLNLPGDQALLIEAVIRANPRTAVVILAGGPVSTPWARADGPAVLMGWYPGEEGGTALARVLFGDVNPSGRMPVGTPHATDPLPPPEDYDLTHGWTYRYLRAPPEYAFGFGLSYTRFRRGGVTARTRGPDQADIALTTRNAGSRGGVDTVQLYLSGPPGAWPRPARELKAFRRVPCAAGEEARVAFSLGSRELAWPDADLNPVVLPGRYRVFLSADPRDREPAAEFTLP